MGRSVFCDESLIKFLENISLTSGFIPGLILGQVTDKKDYVIHLPQTPLDFPKDEGSDGDTGHLGKSFSKVVDINEQLISLHARTVTRMLPGGMWVLGFYVVGPGDIFADKNVLSKIRSIANTIHSSTKGNDYLCGNDPTNQILVFHFCSLSKKFSCKTLDMSSLSSSLRPVDWKFKKDTTTWLKVVSTVNFNWAPCFTVPSGTASMKKKLLECLQQFQTYLNGLFYTINGEFCSEDKPLLDFEKNKKKESPNEEIDDEDENSFQLMFYEFSEPYQKSVEVVKLESEKAPTLIKMRGILVSKVFLNEKATAEFALKAVKDDLLRSFASRLEMHWQTFEEPKTPGDIIRYLPRRALFIPKDSEVSYSDYLFEGEAENDIMESISENLGFTEGKTVALESVWEIPKAMAPTDQPDSTDADNDEVGESSRNSKKRHTNNEVSPLWNTMLLVFIGIGITLFFTFLANFLYS